MSQSKKYKYFPNDSLKEFRFYKDCQNLSAEIFKASAGATKEYRFTICRKVQDISCELIHSVYLANSYQLGSQDRVDEQAIVRELLLRLDELLPVLRKCRCITIGQEGEITKRIGSLKFSYDRWVESDISRIEKMGK